MATPLPPLSSCSSASRFPNAVVTPNSMSTSPSSCEAAMPKRLVSNSAQRAVRTEALERNAAVVT